MSRVLRGFPPSTYKCTPQAQILVRPCSLKKALIYELETYLFANLSGIAAFHKIVTRFYCHGHFSANQAIKVTLRKDGAYGE
jgi:hypothetical protein